MKKLILIFLMLFAVQKINAQEEAQREIQKTILFPENEKIIVSQSTGKYLSVITSDEESKTSKYHIYDLIDGNEKFNEATSNAYYEKVVTIEKLNLYLTIERTMIEEPEDKIIAYDLGSGDKIWQASSSAYYYEISPDSLYITTRNYCDVCLNSEFSIYKLVNGQRLESKYKVHYFRAKWLDNEKILILMHRRYPNPNFRLPADPYLEKDTKLWQRKCVIQALYEKGKISEVDFKAKIDSVENARKENMAVREQWAKSPESTYAQPSPRRFLFSTAKLVIYNALNDIIEDSLDLYDRDGQPVSIPFSGEEATENIDRDASGFYFYIYKNNDVHSIFKYDNNFKLSWVVDLPSDQLIKIKDGESISYKLIKDNTIVGDIDKNTGVITRGRKEFLLSDYNVNRDVYTKKEKKMYKIDRIQNRVEIYKGESK